MLTCPSPCPWGTHARKENECKITHLGTKRSCECQHFDKEDSRMSSAWDQVIQPTAGARIAAFSRLFQTFGGRALGCLFVSMACPPAAAASSCSYTVVIIPLKSRLYGLDALRFYLWVKRLKDLEKEKDALCSGLEILDKARCWYRQRLDENRARKETKSGVNSCHGGAEKDRSFLLRSRIERVNASLGSVMTGSCGSCTGSPSLLAAPADSALRWQHAVLTQKVSLKNQQISMLEMEKDALLEQLHEVQAH
ncbi:suppressor APC domain-containing protein 1 [Nerophis ophidion]|uniref:suppressor APC domain-containing protein 1 n=1 Tax=Nerophis ophidion TaxID=159077 RepID=UPI002ADFE458|nr:suppressor APC domain-containing protein 1 [Nerophis ophidion]